MDLRIKFDKEVTWTWINQGDAKDARQADAEKKILDTILILGDDCDADMIAGEIGVSRQAVNAQLVSMRTQGLLNWKRVKQKLLYSLKDNK